MGEALLMKLGEVKRRLGVGRDKVYGLARRGEIRAVSIGGQTMYETRSVENFLERRNVRAG
jgi:excisionase family DNA binding protein